MESSYLRAGVATVARRVSRAFALGLALSMLPLANALALDYETVQSLQPLDGSFTLPRPPKPLCATLEKQCLSSCQNIPPTRGPTYCGLGCAVARADCESGFTALGQCNAPKGSGCL